MRKQQIIVHGKAIMVSSALLAKAANGLEHPMDCYMDDPDGYGIYQPDPEKLKGPALKLVEVERDALLNDEDATITVAGKTFQMNPKTRAHLMEVINLYSASGNVPADFEWRDIDNVMHPCDLIFLVTLAEKRSEEERVIWTDSFAAKAAIRGVV